MRADQPGHTAAKGLRALVWKRSDFRESSRLITMLSAELGRFIVLGKGAHRPDSQCLGRIDFLNTVEIKMSRGNLPVLHRVRLLHEPRRLREPARYAAACYLAELFEPAFPMGRVDQGLFDLLSGGLRLLERCPRASIPQILVGVELRFLREIGLLPALLACSQCGQALCDGSLYPARRHAGLLCRRHAAVPGHDRLPAAVPARALLWLDRLDRSPGSRWPALPAPPAAVRGLLGRWIHAALELKPRLRDLALRG